MPLSKARLQEALLCLPQFFKNPVQGMLRLPDWEWPILFVLPPAFALACTVLRNLIERDLRLTFLLDIIISPIASILLTGLVAAWFFYGFLFLLKKEFNFRSIYTHIALASIPAQVTSIGTKYFPPINFVGVAASLYLLYYGFVHNYIIDGQKLKRIFFGLYAAFFIWWALIYFNRYFHQDSVRVKATPESLDILEKELNRNKD